MISLIDRYILKLFTSYLVAGLTVFSVLFLTVDFMSSMVRYNVQLSVLFRYYIYLLPSIVYQMIPMASVLSSIFTISSLQKSNELVALFSSGMSLIRISTPIVILTLIISIFGFFFSDLILPVFSKKKNYIYYLEIVKQPGLFSTVKENKIWYRSRNTLFNIKTLNIKKKQAQQLTLYYFDPNWNLIQLITAKEVHMNGGKWALSDGALTLFIEDSPFPLTTSFDKKIISVAEDLGDLKSNPDTSDTLSVTDLKKFIGKNKEAGLDTMHYEVDYYAKYSFAFASSLLAILSIPFSLTGPRGAGRAASVAKCIGLVFLYWAIFSSSITLGRHGAIHPLMAAWAPNAIVSLLAIFFIYRLKK